MISQNLRYSPLSFFFDSALFVPHPDSPCGKGFNVLFAGPEKIKEVHPGVIARLADTEKYQMLPNCFCSPTALHNVPKASKCFYRVLGVVVIPRNTIVV